jgi:hypothetical protein
MFLRALFLVLAVQALAAEPPRFREHVLATNLKGGYQVIAYDVNRDGKPDLIALASGMTELYWFENPGWQLHVLATGMRRMINVAACDGIDEMLVAHEFANQPKGSIGIVSILTPGPDRTQPWTVREIDRLTTSHRVRRADIDGSGHKVFINAPLAGAKAAAPDYRDHIPLVYYKPGEWKRQTIGSENEGVMHGIFINQFRKGFADCILTASFSGLHCYCLAKSGEWQRTEIAKGDPSPWPKSGASDIAVGHLGKRRFLASIEPWHGNQLAIYTEEKGKWTREVIDSALNEAHTVVTADLDGDGKQEVIAGYRGAGRSVHIYSWDGKKWNRTKLDDGGIAASACTAVDLNGDGRIDVACIGSASTNLKWYENLGKH